MKMTNKKSIKNQQGVALVMALIMLLLITIIGVASVRMSSTDTQIAGNNIYSMMVFQGAESALSKVASVNKLKNIDRAALRSNGVVTINQSYFPLETVNNGTKLSTNANIVYERDADGLYGTKPTSTGVPGSGIPYQIFRITAETSLEATSAKAVHVQGIGLDKATQ